MTILELKEKINNRKIFVWGTQLFGISIVQKLQENGFPVFAFIDSIVRKTEIKGLSVYSRENFFQNYTPEDSFVIMGSQGFADVFEEYLQKENFSDKDYFNYNNLTHLVYYIETNNKCNLACRTCSVSQFRNDTLQQMDFDYFKKVIDKICHDDPFVSTVQLYGANEPLLTPNLPQMIHYCKSKNLHVGLSTNLTPSVDYEAFVKAKPDWVRISTSGVGKNYEFMHRKGKYDILLKHMKLLSSLRKEYAPDMQVDVIFHKYKHNTDDIPIIQTLCKELDFQYSCIIANVVGLESVVSYLEGRPIPDAMSGAFPYLCHSIEEVAAKAYENKHLPCSNLKFLRIYHDGSVSLCQCWQRSLMKNVSFLENSVHELKKKLLASPLCNLCKAKGLHQYYTAVFTGVNDEN